MKLNKIFFSVLLSVLSFASYGQQYYAKNLNGLNGLPSLNVRDVVFDQHGFAWIAHDAGISKWDGKEFINYGSSKGNFGSNAWSACFDNKNNLWIAFYGRGLSCFDGKKFANYTKTDSLKSNRVRKVYYSAKWDLLFIGCDDLLSIYNGKNFTHFGSGFNGIEKAPCVMSFLENKDFIYILSYNAVNFKYYPKQNKAYLLDSGEYYITINSSFVNSEKDTIYGIIRSGIRVKSKNQKTEYNGMGQIFGITEDKQKNIWLAAWSYHDFSEPGGLFCFKNNKVVRWNDSLNIQSRELWGVNYFPKQNSLWIMTLQNGLYLYKKTPFTIYKPSYFGLENLKVNTFYIDNFKNFWIINENQIIVKTKNDSLIIINKQPFHKTAQGSILYEFRNAKSKEIQYLTITNDTSRNIYIGTDVGVYKIKDFNAVKHYNYNPYIFFDRKNIAYTFGSGYYYKYPNFPDTSKSSQMFPSTHKTPVDAFVKKENNNLTWFGSSAKGIVVKDGEKYFNLHYGNSGIHNLINAITFDNNNNIIAGAANGELYFMKYIKDSIVLFATLNDKNGLNCQTINWLEVDNNNKLWIGSNTGLYTLLLDSFYVKSKIIFNYFNQNEGYNIFNTAASIKDEQGNIWVSGNNQLLKINPNIEIEKDSSHLVITDFEVNYTQYDSLYTNNDNWYAIPDSPIVLKYYHNSVSFKFTTLNFFNADKEKYFYLLEGFDNKWREADISQRANYTNLPAGDYIFKVYSINTNNNALRNTLEIKFTIEQAFYKTWWFFSFCFLFLAGIAFYIIYKKRKAFLEKEKQKMNVIKQMSELEMKALQGQMNPHFVFNCINSIQNFIFSNKVDDASIYLNDFAKIIRTTFHNASQKHISVQEEITYLNQYLKLEQMRFDNFMDYKIDCDFEAENYFIIPMLIQPFVENSIKHGLRHLKNRKPLLNIRFELKENLMIVSVKDNGIGRVASKEINNYDNRSHQSKGIEITKNRVHLLNINNTTQYHIEIIDVSSTDNTIEGTEVKCYLPIIEF